MNQPKTSQRIPAALSVIFALLIAASVTFYFVHNATAENSKDDDATAEAEAQNTENEEEKEEKAPIPVRTIAAEEGRISSYISATANLVAENQVDVIAEWEGRLDRLEVEEGDRAAKGQVLARLDSTDAEINLQKAEVRAKNAQLKFERAKSLSEQQLLSPEEFDKVGLEHDLAQQELAEAEWRLDKTFIRAPFAGIVTRRMTQLGQHVRPGDQLFTITDFEPLVARIYLPEKDVLALEEGRDVKITLKADESIDVGGRIRQISPVVDTGTGTVKVTVEAVNPPSKVRPGAFVRVDVVRETRPEAVLLPKEAVVRELQRTYVFVAHDEKASKRAVTLGLEEGAKIEAASGLEPGEAVIVAGQGGLKDGAPIKILESAVAGAEDTENLRVAELR